MRVSTKIVGGFGILLLVAIAALAYQVSLIHWMQNINGSLSKVNFEAAASVQTMEQEILDLEPDCKKYFVLNGDPSYERALTETRNKFSEDLGEVVNKARTPLERAALKELSNAWSKFWRDFDDAKASLSPEPNAEGRDLPLVLLNDFDDLNDRAK